MSHHVLDINDKHRDNDNEVSMYQNSYQLEPYNIFIIEHINKIISTMILTNFQCIYNTVECAKLCNKIATNVLTQILKLQFGRYKIIVMITFIENANQPFNVSIGHLWDAKRDNYTTFTLETQIYYMLCCVFGIYYE
ncbi:hypothetical protein KPH14_003627 [Odynerus spinipes]|uniref:Dynein light chain n=1 Tax=Odynerus spinipes TaxID=1348599 RepID=A0AAD9RD34_9HYME|nr:hypothetical protein KPH14_003627 [Odynerus spinipes]